jgi:hypothetical protein
VHRLLAGLGLGALLLLAACGCDHGVFGDSFPIRVDMSTGPVLARFGEGDATPRVAVIDLLAPLTVLDAPAENGTSRRCTDLTVYGNGSPTDPSAFVPRAHPALTIPAQSLCTDENGDPRTPCEIGAAGATTEIAALIGGDAFDTGAVRFDFTTGELTLFSEVAGDDDARGRRCEAQIQHPFRGGGTLSLGGTEVSFPKRRIAFGACLAYGEGDATADDGNELGANVELVLSTAIGPTILTETAYERWRVAAGLDPVPPVAPVTVLLPSGPLTGIPATIDRLALVGRDDDDRGPCRQVYAHHLLTERDCTEAEVDDETCPCPGDASGCSVPAVLELSTTPIAVLIVPDDDPTIQALRAELRPETAEIDGILGTAALAATAIDVEYELPHERVLIRCRGAGCVARPALTTGDDRDEIQACIAGAPAS